MPSPHDHHAVLFDLDGVLTSTTALHASCWKTTLDGALRDWARRGGSPQRRFDIVRDYVVHLDGRPRHDGVRAFLQARGITAPEGTVGSPPDEWSVHGIANRKQGMVERALARDGVEAFPGSVAWVRHLRAAGTLTAVVSSSANCGEVLRAAGIDTLFDVTVDGSDITSLGLRGKPAPDGFLEAARRLGASADRSAVVEDALAGVSAGKAGGFGLVIGVARGVAPDELLRAGADVVVHDLAELLS